MGSSPSLPQAQIPVEIVHQGQTLVRCKGCYEPKVKWKCEECVVMMCDKCKDKKHSYQGHHIIHIAIIKVKICNVKKYYKMKISYAEFLAISTDHLFWIGNGEVRLEQKAIENNLQEVNMTNLRDITSLQKLSIFGDELNFICSFPLNIRDIAVTLNNDLLLATGEQRLKHIKAGSTKVTDSKYVVESCDLIKVHVTTDGRVIAGGKKVLVVMDTDGYCVKKYEKDENNKLIFFEELTSITSTTNGNIFVSVEKDKKVVVLGKTDIISNYRGNSTINREINKFSPTSLVTTPKDNVIVADCGNQTLHILSYTGHLLTTYNTNYIGINFPAQLAIITERSYTVLFIAGRNGILYKTTLTGC